NIKKVLPKSCFDIIKSTISQGKGPVFMKDLEQLILGTLRTMSYSQLAGIMDVEEGLENRIKRFSVESNTIEELLENISTRRYVSTRIQRILINTLLMSTTSEIESYQDAGGPQYIRVLGFKKRATP